MIQQHKQVSCIQEKRMTMKIQFDERTIECNVQYSKRTKIAIQLETNGLITVKAPNGTPEADIVHVMEKNKKWLLDNTNKLEQARASMLPMAKEYQEQGQFLYLGKKYFLHELIEVGDSSEEELRHRLKKFYFTSCKKIVLERIEEYQKQLRVKPKSIEIEESTTKWGSCHSSKKITFNYRLAMAPVEVIDYVIVHELCHLLHMNHDRSFWRRLGSTMPDYKDKEEYLARHGRHMTL